MNKIIIVGNLTRNPELKYSKSGTAIATINIANNRKYKKKVETVFVDAVAFNKTAEFINNYFKKGSPILLDGRLALDVWIDKNGNKRQKHKIIIEKAEFIGNKNIKRTNKTKEKTVAKENKNPFSPTGDAYKNAVQNVNGEENESYDEDIPF